LKIEDVKFWKMKNVVVDRWYENRAFIIGDAAHQFPPSGGYGLNTGVADAFSLAWRIKYMNEQTSTSSPTSIEKVLKETFQSERVIHSNVSSRLY
jgi:2-polyprenyl-6-methoxyphenol hydroxylase-like FAD-dependent oxidoreductase